MSISLKEVSYEIVYFVVCGTGVTDDQKVVGSDPRTGRLISQGGSLK